MSDTSQGEGWWQASDGKWYAPEQHPDYQPPAQPTQPTPPTQAMPMPPTQAMPMPPPGAPPGTPGGPPPGAPGTTGGSSNAKWIIGGAVALVIIVIAAFLLLRDNGSKNNVSAASDTSQSSDKSDTSSSSSKSTSSSSSKNFVDPTTVEGNLLTAADFPAGGGFTDAQFTPNKDQTDPCGQPSPDAKFPPTKDVGSAVQNATQNEFFQQEVGFYKDAATTKKAFDFAVNGIKQCTQGTIVSSDSTSSFAVTSVTDVSSQVGFTATEVQRTVDQFSVIQIGVQLDNAVATYTFIFPTSAGQSAVPDATGIAKEGTQRLLS
jgi:hypothetical protein